MYNEIAESRECGGKRTLPAFQQQHALGSLCLCRYRNKGANPKLTVTATNLLLNF